MKWEFRKKHLGSEIALTFGAGITLWGLYIFLCFGIPPVKLLFIGLVMILGGLAYRSAKNRMLGTAKSSSLRKVLELLALLVIVLGTLSILEAKLIDPVTNLVIPLWAIIAYVIIYIRGAKQIKDT